MAFKDKRDPGETDEGDQWLVEPWPYVKEKVDRILDRWVVVEGGRMGKRKIAADSIDPVMRD